MDLPFNLLESSNGPYPKRRRNSINTPCQSHPCRESCLCSTPHEPLGILRTELTTMHVVVEYCATYNEFPLLILLADSSVCTSARELQLEPFINSCLAAPLPRSSWSSRFSPPAHQHNRRASHCELPSLQSTMSLPNGSLSLT